MLDRTEELGRSAGAADPADVATPEVAVRALYDVISGPADTERDWDRLRSLFDPRVRFVIGRWMDEGGEPRDAVVEWDLDTFVEGGREQWLDEGFWESEIAARVETFGNVAHVMSSYESRVGSEDSDPVGRGVNSVQLLRHGGRWWIVGIVWDVETPDNPLPPELGGGG